MVTVHFTQNLQRHIESNSCEVSADTVSAALDAVFSENPKLRSYILDDTGSVRKHIAIFLDGNPIMDRATQSDAVKPDSEVFVMQALSGG